MTKQTKQNPCSVFKNTVKVVSGIVLGLLVLNLLTPSVQFLGAILSVKLALLLGFGI